MNPKDEERAEILAFLSDEATRYVAASQEPEREAESTVRLASKATVLRTMIAYIKRGDHRKDKAPTETDTLAADHEALRAKAGAVCEAFGVGCGPALAALRAELDKPSGAGLVAERDAARAAQKECLEIAERATIQRDKAEAIADAWKALAKARAMGGEAGLNARFAALAALRALGIDPEA